MQIKLAELERLQGRNKALAAEVAAKEKLLGEREEELVKLQKQLEAAKQEVDEWKFQALSLQEQGADLKSTADVSSTTRDVTSKVLLELSERAMHLEAERLQMHEMMEQLSVEVEDELRKRDDEVASLRQANAEQISNIEAACKQEYECKLNTLQATLRLRESELVRLTQSETYLNERVRSLERRRSPRSSISLDDFLEWDDSACMSEAVKDGWGTMRRELIASLRAQLEAKDQHIVSLKEREQSWADQMTWASRRRTDLETELNKAIQAGRELVVAGEQPAAGGDEPRAREMAATIKRLQTELKELQDSKALQVADHAQVGHRAHRHLIRRVLMPVGMLSCSVIGAAIGRKAR